jgi:hypothetical protein
VIERGRRIGTNLPQVCPHCRTRGVRIVASHRVEQHFVMLLAPLRAAMDAKDLFALLAEQFHDGMNQCQNQIIIGGVGENLVEMVVRRDERIRVRDVRIHRLNGGAQLGNIRVIRALSRQCGNLRLEDCTYLYQIATAAMLAHLHRAVQRIAQRRRRAVDDDSATAGAKVYQPLLRQRLHGLAHRGSAGAELLRKLAFGGEPIARAQVAAQNLLLDLRRDLLEHLPRLDGSVHSEPLPSRWRITPHGHTMLCSIGMMIISSGLARWCTMTDASCQARILRTDVRARFVRNVHIPTAHFGAIRLRLPLVHSLAQLTGPDVRRTSAESESA